MRRTTLASDEGGRTWGCIGSLARTSRRTTPVSPENAPAQVGQKVRGRRGRAAPLDPCSGRPRNGCPVRTGQRMETAVAGHGIMFRHTGSLSHGHCTGTMHVAADTRSSAQSGSSAAAARVERPLPSSPLLFARHRSSPTRNLIVKLARSGPTRSCSEGLAIWCVWLYACLRPPVPAFVLRRAINTGPSENCPARARSVRRRR